MLPTLGSAAATSGDFEVVLLEAAVVVAVVVLGVDTFSAPPSLPLASAQISRRVVVVSKRNIMLVLMFAGFLHSS